jgi:mutator protein MutT
MIRVGVVPGRNTRSAMENSPSCSFLIPYLLSNNSRVYLQKRTEDAPTSPGYFGFFGGLVEEGETPEIALEREIQEELGIHVSGYAHFKSYDFTLYTAHIYILPIDDSFEGSVKVSEGEYGKLFSENEASGIKIKDDKRQVLSDVFAFLKKQNGS